MAQIKHWINAFRLRTLPLALSTVFAGSIAAYTYKLFNFDIFIWACITTLLLQILSNLANDYGDAISGADSKRIGPERMVQSGRIRKNEMKSMIGLFVLLSLASGIYLLKISFPNFFSITSLLFLLAGFAAITAAIKYTAGSNPYGYKGYGDFFVFIFFGIVGVWGTFFLHTKTLSGMALMPAISIGLLSAGVLNLNNLRDENTDRQANKRSIVVQMGQKFGVTYHVSLIVLALMTLTIFTASIEMTHFKWLYFITLPLYIIHLKKVTTIKNPSLFDAELKRLAITTFLTVIIWGVGIVLAS